jgi:putative heme-binding domain-containing protein
VSVLALFLGAALTSQEPYELPPDMRVERAADAVGSFIALAFDPQGVALVAQEDGGILWLEDRDGDRFFEAEGVFSDKLRGVHGLAFKDKLWYAVGSLDGALGIWRVTPSASGREARAHELVLPIESEVAEHAAHAVVPGPDGMLYAVLGDHARLGRPPRGAFPLLAGGEAHVPGIQVLDDPNGQSQGVRYPCGYVARIDPKSGEWDYHSVGFRNPYDIAFDAGGELFTYESDMEWDLGLPWYRPTRFLHLVPGGDYGWRPGSGVIPSHAFDVLPAAVEAGRGSPTGLAFCDSEAFPARYRGALFAGDWAEGEILAFFPRPEGAGYRGELETVLRTGSGLSLTDLAFGPGGDLYFVSGGRGTLGRFERLTYTGTPEPRSLRPARAATWLDQPVTVEQLESRDPVVVRRALEGLIFAAACPGELVEPVLARLGDADRNLRFAAYQVARKHRLAPDAALSFRAAALASAAALDPDAARPLFDAGDDGELLDALRGREILLSAPERPAPGDLVAAFPHRDARVSREIALLLAALQPPGWIEALLGALAGESDRTQQIHYAYCLTQPPAAAPGGETGAPGLGDWSEAQARQLFAWLDVAETWTGGASFGGYLAAMRARFAERFDGEARLALALEAPKKERLGLRSVAHFAAGLEVEQVERLIPAIQYAWGVSTLEDRRAALRAFGGVPAPGLLAFLRRQCDNPDAPRDEALAALARSAASEDYTRFVDGLGASGRETAEACAQALARIERRPGTSEAFRTALDLARRHGPVQGRTFLELFATWSGEPLPGASEDWDGALARYERWGALTFPEFRREDADAARRPSWSYEATLAFLEASRERAGSAARGAAVFQKATCSSCHVHGQSAWLELVGFGPDLLGVTARFPLDGLLESIWFPSKSVADVYRTSIATTTAGLRIEGRIVVQDDQVIVIKKADGTPVTLERSVIEELQVSPLSTMPEGLLAALSLEQVKDLFAFLASDGTPRASEPDWQPLLDEEGRNLWEGDLELWKIRGGVLVGRSPGLEHSAYLATKTRFADFELEFDVKLTDGIGNGGLQYRSSLPPDRPDPLGYQLDLGEVYWGSLYASDGRGLVAGPADAVWREVVDRDGWNHFHLRAEGDRHVIELNGTRTVDTRDAAFSSGILAFQLHAGPPCEVRYANARLRELR